MIDWLQKAFGFIVHAKHMDGDSVAHAELGLGSSIIMLGEVRDDDYGRIVGMPRDGAGKSTYIAIKDADALYARARQAGAEILEELSEREYGSREFICRDPEGNIWCFGTYWPESNAETVSVDAIAQA